MTTYELPPNFESLVATEFDGAFRRIEHYRVHPEMIAWVGRNYSAQPVKILIIGESHYLPDQCSYHRLPEKWYAGVSDDEKTNSGDYFTRRIIVRGINNNWKERSKTIYRNIERALLESTLFREKPTNAFTEIAFMNYFQRPAQRAGDSIAATGIDSRIAASVHLAVTGIIAPDIVVFTSRLAWSHAKNHYSSNPAAGGIEPINTPHPGSAWWGRRSEKYQGKTGKERFIGDLNAAIAEKLLRG